MKLNGIEDDISQFGELVTHAQGKYKVIIEYCILNNSFHERNRIVTAPKKWSLQLE